MRLVGPPDAAILFVAVLEKTMEKREMNRIDVALVGLEVIALMKNLFSAHIVRGCSEKIIVGKQRGLSRFHVREDDSCSFLTRIGKVLYRIAVLAASGLAGLLETAAADIIKPTMIEAAQSPVFDSPVAQVCYSVRAVISQKSDPPFIVDEPDQIFTEHVDGQRRPALG